MLLAVQPYAPSFPVSGFGLVVKSDNQLRRRGVGDVTAGQVGSIGAGALSIANVAQSGAPLSTQVATSIGSGLLTAAPFTGPAAPFLAVAGLVADFLGVMGVGSGCGQTCVLSSQYANKAESILKQNLDTYMALPAPRDPLAQAAALRVFDAIWSDLVAACSNPALGSAGQRCISDRQAGACHYGTAPNCWNWFVGYRDPIANDPNVAAFGSSQTVNQVTGANVPVFGNLSLSQLAIPALILLALWAVS